MQGSEKLCLQWNDFKENAALAFGKLRNKSEFSDVTLVSQDGEKIEAHKMILAGQKARGCRSPDAQLPHFPPCSGTSGR